MKWINFSLLILMSGFSLASDKVVSKTSDITLLDLLTCKFTESQINEDYDLSDDIHEYIFDNFHDHKNDLGMLSAKQEFHVFNSKIIGFLPGLGMRPWVFSCVRCRF